MRVSYLLKLREELAALKTWHVAGFNVRAETELDAVGHRIMRMAELIHTIQKIVELN